MAVRDVTLVALIVAQAARHTGDAAVFDPPPAEGDLTGLSWWVALTGGDWVTVAAFQTASVPVPVSDAPRAAAVVTAAGRLGVVCGFGYVAAPVGREYVIGPFDPPRWAAAWLPAPVEYTGGGR